MQHEWAGQKLTREWLTMEQRWITMMSYTTMIYYDIGVYLDVCMYIYNILYIYTIPSDFGETLDLDIEDNLLSSSIFLPSLQHKGDTIP